MDDEIAVRRCNRVAAVGEQAQAIGDRQITRTAIRR